MPTAPKHLEDALDPGTLPPKPARISQISMTKDQIFREFDIPEDIASLSEKKINFARLYAETGNKTQAALSVGFSVKSARSRGYHLASEPAVAVCIDYFRDTIRKRVPRITVDAIKSALWQTAKEARAKGNHVAAAKCYELLGKDAGMFGDFLDINFRKHETTSDADLELLALAYQAKLGLPKFSENRPELRLPTPTEMTAAHEGELVSGADE